MEKRYVIVPRPPQAKDSMDTIGSRGCPDCHRLLGMIQGIRDESQDYLDVGSPAFQQSVTIERELGHHIWTDHMGRGGPDPDYADEWARAIIYREIK